MEKDDNVYEYFSTLLKESDSTIFHVLQAELSSLCQHFDKEIKHSASNLTQQSPLSNVHSKNKPLSDGAMPNLTESFRVKSVID